MPKVTKYPRLRTKLYKGASGRAYVYYTYDMRPEGKPDIRLGKDWDEAVRRWDELHNNRPRIIGRLQEAFDRWREQEIPKYENPDTRNDYARDLKRIEPVFGQMAWDEVTLPILREYLDRRTAKSRGNRELAVLSIVWGRAILWGMTRLPWPATGVRKWKNQEKAREFRVTDELFAAVYAQGDQVLRDCMDIATATGVRLTDARTIVMPTDGVIRHKARKTGKGMEVEIATSPTLSAIVERRQKLKVKAKVPSITLLTTKTGRAVSEAMLWNRWDKARTKAAAIARESGNPAFAEAIEAMYLRDMRKRAADLADSLQEAANLLQHDKPAITRKHYRQGAEKLRAVR